MNYSNFLELKLPSRDNTTDTADINAISENFETIDGAFLDLVEKEIPKLQTKENMNLNFDDSSTNEKQYPSVPAVVNFTNRKVEPLKIVNSASGNAISLKDSANDKLKGLKLYGKTTQDGTPTPTEPKELKSVGDSGSFEIGVYGKNLLDVSGFSKKMIELGGELNGVPISVSNDGLITANGTATGSGGRLTSYSLITLPKGKYRLVTLNSDGTTISSRKMGGVYLTNIANTNSTIVDNALFELEETTTFRFGLNVDRGKTYNQSFYVMVCLADVNYAPYEPYKAKQSITFTDTLRGVGDIADEIDFARGVTTQRFKKVVFNGSDNEDWKLDNNANFSRAFIYLNDMETPLSNSDFTKVMCDKFSQVDNNSSKEYSFILFGNKAFEIIMPVGTWTNATERNSWLQANPITVVYRLATPIETPLSETELNAYRQLHTNKPATTIISEADMEVSYVADTKLYIDNKIAELTALTLEG